MGPAMEVVEATVSVAMEVVAIMGVAVTVAIGVAIVVAIGGEVVAVVAMVAMVAVGTDVVATGAEVGAAVNNSGEDGVGELERGRFFFLGCTCVLSLVVVAVVSSNSE